MLRAVAGGAAIAQAGAYLRQAEPGTVAWTLGGAALLCGVGLVVGFLTPGIAAGVSLSTVAIAAAAAPPAAPVLAADWRLAAFIAADAIALAMLGPGAHSIDAWLFGRREILVSDDTRRRTPR